MSGPVAEPDLRRVPLRGDLAHIGLAGRYFVPHYAVPQPRAILPGGAPLHIRPKDDSEELCTLMEGDSFELLDITGGWAWGCLSLEGPVGYVRIERLEPIG
ncbi:SH3 domain-containing protein [Altererythrobacter aestuarii]|uniref:SH3 domain-containing protein n=1 Tax=Alteraurantiacibacter aestuarii TaxID=650004 RepID=A0A844ZMS4_9SPHN|nr:SH3 domain-containing protein [Alteraurantiacibacter aestuarii]